MSSNGFKYIAHRCYLFHEVDHKKNPLKPMTAYIFSVVIIFLLKAPLKHPLPQTNVLVDVFLTIFANFITLKASIITFSRRYFPCSASREDLGQEIDQEDQGQREL